MRLKVGVPWSVSQMPPSTGAGKIWHRVLPGLRRSCDVRIVRDPGGSRWRPEVWLTDGHQGPLPVEEPVVVHLHEAAWDLPELRPMIEEWFVAAYEEPSAEAARHAAAILTPSSSSRDQIVASAGVAPSKVRVAPHGVDAALFRPARRRPRELLAAAGADPDRPYVLFASVLHPRKNLEALREAMTSLVGEGRPHGLVLIAAGPPDRSDPRQLEQAAEADLPGSTGRVTRLHDLEEDAVAAVMASSAAFCLPSLMEGFGLTALEAMACGVPVVVSDRGSLPEVVGDAGLVVEPTAAGVAAGLASVLDDAALARTLGDAGRRRALTFSWEASTRVWRGALEAAVRGEAPGTPAARDRPPPPDP